MKLTHWFHRLARHKGVWGLLALMFALCLVVTLIVSYSGHSTLSGLMHWTGRRHPSVWFVLILQVFFIVAIWALWEQRLKHYQHMNPRLSPKILRQAKLLRLAFVACVLLFNLILFF